MNVLHLISSTRGHSSYSRQLGDAIIDRFRETHGHIDLMEWNLADAPHPAPEFVAALFLPEAERRHVAMNVFEYSDQAVDALMAADIIVIDVPMHNFTIPSTLKAWLDHIARSGKTFRYTENGPVGMVAGKKVFLSIASGGIYSEGPMKMYDFIEPYLRAVLGFLGMTDITVLRVEGVAVPQVREGALGTGLMDVKRLIGC